jgi:hypothetical protein
MTSLYAEGWRQGTIFSGLLPLDAVVLSESSSPERDQREHSLWVIATQDCDLDMTDIDEHIPTVELRPVLTDDPPHDWGIRSARLLLTELEYISSTSPRPLVAASVLTSLLAGGADRREVEPIRRRAFTTWLGKRYDRPAVPPTLLPLARRVADLIKSKRHRVGGTRVRDILLQVDEDSHPFRYSLYAVLDNEGDAGTVREWLADIALEVEPSLGVADIIEAAPATGISLDLIETSYSADVTQLTWRTNRPEPDGAS